ncbi:hypothetical protein [Paenibacillus sp. NAIST15-1]|nr:hypothetical protein [Paenibacillus sp. NAIST15-1]
MKFVQPDRNGCILVENDSFDWRSKIISYRQQEYSYVRLYMEYSDLG